MPADIRFYVGTPLRKANIKKLAIELFDNNQSALVNYAINETFGLDPDTGERLPNAPIFNKQPALYSIRPGHSMVNDATTTRPPRRGKRKKR